MSNRYSPYLLILWIILGAGLRFNHLTAKPIWTDEFATLVFSLGNHFDSIPLGQVIDTATLLSPLKPSSSSLNEVIQGILDNDNHPPLYFALAHLWLSLFPTADYVNLWAARALPALFGVFAIPLSYFLAYWIVPSRLFSHLAALLMAVSPYGVFISQEARHYTLAVIWVLLSVGCFIKSGQYFAKNQRIPPKIIIAWIIINSLGLSTHFFCGLAFFAEILTLGVWFIYHLITPKFSLANFDKYYRSWRSLLWVILGTLTSALLWLWMVQQRDYGNGMTQWIKQDNSHFLGVISPPFQLFAAWLTMVCLLPVESPNMIIVIISALAMLICVIFWFAAIAWRTLKQAVKSEAWGLETRLLLGGFSSLTLIYLGITYIIGMDITRGARYSFTFLPFMVFLLAIILTLVWQTQRYSLPHPWTRQDLKKFCYENGQFITMGVITLGIFSSLTITNNLGYQKYYRPDQFLTLLQTQSPTPHLIATTHQSLVQTGEMMSLAWESQTMPQLQPSLSFLLIPQTQENSPQSTEKLTQIVQSIPKPVSVWPVNFKAPVKLPNCALHDLTQAINGYQYQHYQCFPASK